MTYQTKLGLGAAALAFVAVAGCGAPAPADPEILFPDMADPTPFTRAYSLAESPDGQLRIFAQEDRDETDLFMMRKGADGSWSAPEEIVLPHSRRLTAPVFAAAGDFLYYGSDEPIAELSGRSELNIWRVALTPDGFGEPEHLPGEINTGAIEKPAAMGPDGTLYLITDHPRSGTGGLDVMMARFDEAAGSWQVMQMPDGFNDPRADDHFALTPDGKRAFFYTHRGPKMGVVDIFTATLGADGQWSIPVNLGPPVNTDAIDFGAGVSADGKTLFFSRDGRLMAIPIDVALSGEGWQPESES